MADWSLTPGLTACYEYGHNYSVGEGTYVYADSSAHTKGSWTEICGASDVEGAAFEISVEKAGGNMGYLIDVGIGPDSGSVEPIVENWFLWPDYAMAGGHTAHLSLGIPKGSKIWARCQCSYTGGQFMAILFRVYGTSLMPSQPLSRTLTFGALTGTTKGTLVDPGAAANTKGDWAELAAGSAVVSDIRELHALVSHANDTYASAAWCLDVGIGAASSEEVVVPDLKFHSRDQFTDFQPTHIGPIPVCIPAGTRIACRAACLTGTEAYRKLYVVLVGLS